MCDELHAMGMKLMVSVWPTVQEDSENYRELLEKATSCVRTAAAACAIWATPAILT